MSTYDHRVWKTGLPVRSAVLKPHAGRLVVGWVTTSESLLLYVFLFYFIILVVNKSINRPVLVVMEHFRVISTSISATPNGGLLFYSVSRPHFLYTASQPIKHY
ncbi:hypothetical protein BO96DRAFT_491455 [Aspergillus niger CBS 101883]|nr:uncharacterized protein BO96DRAFT_491455 [Aspergillus niger CBS 101883]PYH50463.1 hypothetical protein BO96DRAFT_491455 [Aspergillus niger CBS 101883]